MKPEKCRRCDGELEIGFIVDHMLGSRLQLSWGKGKPARSMMSGVVSPSGLDPVPITTYRCKECGLLESYVFEDGTE